MNRLEILNEVYGPTEWSASALASVVRCMELAQEETRKSMEQSLTDPENQPNQYGMVPEAESDMWQGRYHAVKGDLERAIKVLDALWDKKVGKRITQEWAQLLSKYGVKK